MYNFSISYKITDANFSTSTYLNYSTLCAYSLSSVFLFSSVSLGRLFLEPAYQRSSMLLALNRFLIGPVSANCVHDVRSPGRQGC